VELTLIRPQTIHALRLVSSVFTPNGDGTNDELQIEFDLLNLVGAVSVTVDLYDLSGRKLGRVFDGVAASGRFSAAWDGRDGEGHLLAPGLYIIRLAVDTDQGLATAERVVSLAY
jgi:flagellar hook assembly protein FlgD